MAIYRNVQLSFWTDNKVEDDFTPEDKYFYLYLLTNPQTNICGCYEVSYSQMVNQTGYNKDTINRLLDRFEKIHDIIRYNRDTKEILILNWYKYNWSTSEKTLIGVEKVAKYIKSYDFKRYILSIVDGIRNNTPIMVYQCPIQASVSDTVSDSIIDYKEDVELFKRIIAYLNNKCETNYKYQTEHTQKRIRERLLDGYCEKDFYTVIDKKCEEWMGTEREKFLRPETLFGDKFESYLNQKIISSTNSGKTKFSNFAQRDYDFGKLEEQLLATQNK